MNEHPIDREQYMTCVEHIVTLVEHELEASERRIREGNLEDVRVRIPSLISMVNMVGYLRGQDNAFLDIRPTGLGEHQSTLRQYEDDCERRLLGLLAAVSDTPEGRRATEARIRTYYIANRLGAED